MSKLIEAMARADWAWSGRVWDDESDNVKQFTKKRMHFMLAAMCEGEALEEMVTLGAAAMIHENGDWIGDNVDMAAAAIRAALTVAP